jgi:hypothetical protein
MEAADAAIVALGALVLVPFVSRLRHLALRALVFGVKWSASAAVMAVLVTAVSETSAYGALRLLVAELRGL